MRLIGFTLGGYRRFLQPSSVKLHGDLVAFVGPNEAGKSSLLRAITHLHKDDEFARDEKTRRHDVEPSLTWHFELSKDNLELISHVPEAVDVRSVRITKKNGDAKIWRFLPGALHRDTTLRSTALSVLEAHLAPIVGTSDDERLSKDNLQMATDILGRADEVLDDESLAHLTTVADALTELLARLRDEDDDESEPAIANTVQVGAAVEALRAAIEKETEPTPWRKCVDALQPELPSIVLFSAEDRSLASEYDLETVADNPPPALMHLSKFAELDLQKLRDDAVAGEIADVSTRRDEANRVLVEAFDKAWNQQGIAVQFEVQGTQLHIQATTPEDRGVSSIADRSEGMRWFAALLAYAHGWEQKPILLVDELESHLHYDAQADLIEVLSRQEYTTKVLYTTHSIGALPPDLGQGVRVVEQLDRATSRLENGFWRNGAGFSPLLSAMGAAATSLTPTRHAILGEGPSDAVILPTLLRQATGRKVQFQVAPGLASVAAIDVPDLDAEAGRVAFVVDGDPAGIAIEKKLLGAGVNPSRITKLIDPSTADALILEDFVDEHVLADAWNAEIQQWQTGAPEIPASEFTSPCCIIQAEQWARDNGVEIPDKVAVAQRVLDQAYSDEKGEVPIFRGSRKQTLEWLHAELGTAIGIID